MSTNFSQGGISTVQINGTTVPVKSVTLTTSSTTATGNYVFNNGPYVSSTPQMQIVTQQPMGWQDWQIPREFNRYVNASDLLEEFIAYLNTQRVRQDEVMDLPIELFIKWLVLQACEHDGVAPDSDVTMTLPPQPRCLGCQKFLPKGIEVPLHDERCAGFFFTRNAMKAIAA